MPIDPLTTVRESAVDSPDRPPDPGGAGLDVLALTTRMAKGDEAAFQEFYTAYFHRLLRYILVLSAGREEVAREALQATFIRVARHIKAFSAEAAFWSWLTVLAKSSLIDERRKQTRYQGFLERLFRMKPVDAPTDDDPDLRLDAALQSTLALLAEDERDLIQRKYYAKQPVKEIALTLGATEKAIELRLLRARRKLKSLVLAQLENES